MSETQSPAARSASEVPEQITGVLEAYGMDSRTARLCELTSGHINRSWHAATGDHRDLVIQRINHAVFTRPVELVENIGTVTRHLRRRLELERVDQPDRRCLELVATEKGRDFHRDAENWVWRAFRYIDRTVTHHRPKAHLAGAAAGEYGRFQDLLSDLDAARLHVTIPSFHDTRARFAQLERAAAEDRAGRLEDLRAEVAEIAALRGLAERLDPGALPTRIVHNDTKLTNVLFDADDGEALCVIDLDTVMPGLVAHDFGDMVRSMGNRFLEAEPPGTRVEVDDRLFAALAEGYLGRAAPFLEEREVASLVPGALAITAEMACRFLADHLDGDVYFRVSRPEENRDRGLTQLALLRSLLDREEQLEEVVEATSRAVRSG